MKLNWKYIDDELQSTAEPSMLLLLIHRHVLGNLCQPESINTHRNQLIHPPHQTKLLITTGCIVYKPTNSTGGKHTSGCYSLV